jgi:hypothetical protein
VHNRLLTVIVLIAGLSFIAGGCIAAQAGSAPAGPLMVAVGVALIGVASFFLFRGKNLRP